MGFWEEGVQASGLNSAMAVSFPLGDPIDGSPPGSTVPGILQARTLEWVAISFSNPQGQKGVNRLVDTGGLKVRSFMETT